MRGELPTVIEIAIALVILVAGGGEYSRRMHMLLYGPPLELDDPH